MDIRNLKTFIRVAELKSFTKAAREMMYVQSTVTMQIQQLERELGYPLFDRIGRTVTLTALGQQFLPYAYEMIHIAQKATMLEQDWRQLHGTLRVGVLESLLFGPLLEVLPRFKQNFKNLDLQLKIGQAAELREQLRKNQLDMVYLSAGINTDPDLHCCCRWEEHLVFLGSSEHPLAKKTNIPLEEVMEHDFIVTEHGGICYGRLRELAAGRNILLRTSVEVDSVFVIAGLIEKSMDLAFLPEYAVKKQLQEGKLVKLDVDLPQQIYYSQILTHKRHWTSPYMTELIEAIKAHYPNAPIQP